MACSVAGRSNFTQPARRKPVLATMLALAISLPVAQRTGAIDATEAQLKAAYLYQFTQFIDWPVTAFDAPDAPFQLCVAGSNSIGDALAPIAERRHGAHAIVVRRVADDGDRRGCHVLYIDASSKAHETAGMPVLTVSSEPHFAERGGMIEFIRVGTRLKFVINRAACARAGLSCSAKLLEAAFRIVNDNVEPRR